MNLSSINLFFLSTEEINKILFDPIIDDQKNADYIIVFGNPTFYKERARKASELYRQNRSDKIIVSGGRGHLISRGKLKKKEAYKMYDTLIRNGVEKSHIYIEEDANNTYENVQNIATLLKENTKLKDVKNIILVSNEYHLRRCYLLMKKRLPNVHFTLVKTENKKYDRNHWYQTLQGKVMIYIELYFLKRFAKKGKIKDERAWIE